MCVVGMGGGCSRYGGGGSVWGVFDNLHCAVDTEEAVELEMFIFIFYLSIHGKQFFSEGGLLFVAIQGRFFPIMLFQQFSLIS